ncbi:hydroxymethylbilane synthase [Moheibacter sediminis]|uniref:Hydroxymethylbilane synthase n=1 Tax=Moheibacter sediminis TaxID=1434700 RepID=A0A1W1ZS65_9FLAO|nr:hydroxymethylbilane synthase [Moheibacter sediminis]SMC51163.1 hydroxymethylbilane synthase [Moheibacter sediminis]
MQKIRIGTRKSPLAMWQAELVASKLKDKNISTEIVPITSDGDINLKQPIYQLGISGVFTHSLDTALINNQIDIAVHSLKDVPTILPEEIELVSCLERGNPYDVLIYKSDKIFEKSKRTIGTGSLRRKSFWLNKFPQDEVENLRGNVQLRLQKLIESDWDGAIFAYAGIERSGILGELNSRGLKYQTLEWMIPAPSQGIVGITVRKGFEMPKISHENSTISAKIERQFLNILEGGCTAPIGGFAEIIDEIVHFKGAVLSLDGSKIILVDENFLKYEFENKGKELAEKCLNNGAKELIQQVQKELKA